MRECDTLVTVAKIRSGTLGATRFLHEPTSR
jgi:hypothetical protein